jgi:hypothetical protein
MLRLPGGWRASAAKGRLWRQVHEPRAPTAQGLAVQPRMGGEGMIWTLKAQDEVCQGAGHPSYPNRYNSRSARLSLGLGTHGDNASSNIAKAGQRDAWELRDVYLRT